MVERIRQILEIRQLTPTQFADAIGVGRPIISHILSGRNKPSLEVVQKIIGAFPDLALPWLLNGTGPVMATMPAAPVAGTPADELTPNNASEAANGNLAESNNQLTPRRAAKATPAPLPTPVAPPQVTAPAASAPEAALATSIPPAPEPAAPPQPGPELVAPPTPLVTAATGRQEAAQVKTVAEAPTASLTALAEPGKAIRRIVIFYQDGTFTDYRPETP